jgi:hypothetical protein
MAGGESKKRWVLQLAAAVFISAPAVENGRISCKLAARKFSRRSFTGTATERRRSHFSSDDKHPFTNFRRQRGVAL